MAPIIRLYDESLQSSIILRQLMGIAEANIQKHMSRSNKSESKVLGLKTKYCRTFSRTLTHARVHIC